MTTSIYLDGKHPSFKDFISLGLSCPFAKALSQWLHEGFALWIHNKLNNQLISWRFWAVGSDKGKRMLYWGIMKDSSDSIGRPYPLMILARSKLNDLSKHWVTLPTILNNSWTLMEHIGVNNFDGMNDMQQILKRLLESVSNLTNCFNEKFNAKQNSDIRTLASKITYNSKNKVLKLPLEESDSDPSNLSLLYKLINNQVQIMPRIVFAGGSNKQPYLYLFYRPLVLNDFVMLWSSYKKDSQENES